jgi:arylsulfatase A-like enzyme
MRQELHRALRTTGYALAGLLVLLQAAPAVAGQVSASSLLSTVKRNVLLIIGDDMGVEHFAPYVDYYDGKVSDLVDADGNTVSYPDTPNINDLAGAGVTFLNAWSSPLCSATRAGIYTGLYSTHNSVYGVIEGDESLDSTIATFADVAAGKGYKSGLFGKWHLGLNYWPAAAGGWDEFRGSLKGELDDYYEWTKISQWHHSTFGILLFAGIVYENTYPHVNDPDHYATFINVDDALAWIGNQSGPWVATVAFNAAHTAGGQPGTLVGQDPPNRPGTPGCVPSGSTEQSDIFNAIIECMDTEIGELLDGVSDAAMAKTTIIFIGDNGTLDSMNEVAAFDGKGKGTVYEGGVNVPMIIADGCALRPTGQSCSGTGRVVSPGRTSTALVQTVDLFATIAKIAGVDTATGDSFSLTPILHQTATKTDRNFAFTMVENSGETEVAVRGLNLMHSDKLIHHNDGTCELYDLAQDRWEMNPIAPTFATMTDYLTRKGNLLNQIASMAGLSLTCN